MTLHISIMCNVTFLVYLAFGVVKCSKLTNLRAREKWRRKEIFPLLFIPQITPKSRIGSGENQEPSSNLDLPHSPILTNMYQEEKKNLFLPISFIHSQHFVNNYSISLLKWRSEKFDCKTIVLT